MATREEIVREARTWLGTSFHHQGRIKNVGCDCIGLVVGVVHELDIPSLDGNGKLSQHDNTNYGRMPDGKSLKAQLDRFLNPISLKDIQPGDILLLKFEKEPQHVAIISDYHGSGLGMIHCYAQSRKVVEHRLDDLWKDRIISAYSLI